MSRDCFLGCSDYVDYSIENDTTILDEWASEPGLIWGWQGRWNPTIGSSKKVWERKEGLWRHDLGKQKKSPN